MKKYLFLVLIILGLAADIHISKQEHDIIRKIQKKIYSVIDLARQKKYSSYDTSSKEVLIFSEVSDSKLIANILLDSSKEARLSGISFLSNNKDCRSNHTKLLKNLISFKQMKFETSIPKSCLPLVSVKYTILRKGKKLKNKKISSQLDLTSQEEKGKWPWRETVKALPEGKHLFSESLHVPKGKILILKAGSELIFSNHTHLFVEGSLLVEGKTKKKVKISGDEKWKGLFILNADRVSLNQVHIRGGVGGDADGILFNTSLGIYSSSNVDINSLVLESSRATDAIHFKNTKLSFHDVVVKDSVGDAIDFDRVEGEGSMLRIYETKADGIDFYNSRFKLTDVYIEKARDKCVSIGEKSRVILNNIYLKKCDIGIAVKDESSLTIKKWKIEETPNKIIQYTTSMFFKNKGHIVYE